jgi:hypothetical protein
VTLPEAIGVCNVIISLYREASSFIIVVVSITSGVVVAVHSASRIKGEGSCLGIIST